MASIQTPHGNRRPSGGAFFDNTQRSASQRATEEGKLPSSSDTDQSTDMELSSIHSSDAEDYTDGDDDDEESGLTRPEHKKRRRRRRTAISPSNRIAGDGLQQEERGIVKVTLLKNIIVNGLLIALWYTFSISISVYNKWMFSAENLDFHFPLFTTSLHMIVQFALASTVLICLPRFRPGRDGSKNRNEDQSHSYQRVESQSERRQQPLSKKPLMTRSFYLTRIGPCGTATALDIGLGNFSLRFISLTFFTMCKSSVLIFVLLFAFVFRLEKPTWKLCGIITLMTTGVILMVSGEAAFNALGFILVMTASLSSGFRWSLTQILLLRNPATSNPFSSIFFLTPIMFLALFILAIPIEGFTPLVHGIKDLSATHNPFLATLILLFPGVLAFMMVAAEFALLKRTSVVTLSVCGIFKEVLTISAASLTFGDELSPVNLSGLIVTIVSIAGYNWLKYDKMKREAKKEAHSIVAGTDDTGSGPSKHLRRGSILDEDAFEIGRDSTDSISGVRGGQMRDSLQLATAGGQPGFQRAPSPTKSRLKRPEGLE